MHHCLSDNPVISISYTASQTFSTLLFSNLPHMLPTLLSFLQALTLNWHIFQSCNASSLPSLSPNPTTFHSQEIAPAANALALAMCPRFHMEIWDGIRVTPEQRRESGESLSWPVTWKDFQCQTASAEACSQLEATKQAKNSTSQKTPQACFRMWPALLPGHLRAKLVAGLFNSWHKGWWQ